MPIYTIKVAIRGISPMIWRRFRLSSNTSIADLHYIIQISMGWDDTHLHQFRIYAKRYGLYRDGAAGFADNAYQVVISDFEFDVGDKFTYEYNYFESRLCDLRVEKIEVCDTDFKQPVCIGGRRIYYEYPVRSQFEMIEEMLPLIKKLMIKASPSRLIKAKALAEEYQSIFLNRRRINQQLLAYHTDPTYC